MSIRRFKRLSGGHGRSQSNKLARQLQKAHELIEDHVWMEARQLLEELNQRYPNREDVLAPLAITFYHLNERLEYLGLCVQINKLTPNDPDHRLALASAYLMNLRPMLARHVLKQFLSRWPNHKESGRAKEMFSGLEERLQSIFEEMGLSGDEGVELAVLHEESQVAMEAGKFKEGIAKTEELIRRKPDFKAAYNNLSLMQYYNGQIADAIANAERALSIKPDDFHAHSNLARYLLAEGRAE
ncbi:MAG: tetratricopeptide repeat protein, partial [Blastocatellia bacterium]